MINIQFLFRSLVYRFFIQIVNTILVPLVKLSLDASFRYTGASSLTKFFLIQSWHLNTFQDIYTMRKDLEHQRVPLLSQYSLDKYSTEVHQIYILSTAKVV